MTVPAWYGLEIDLERGGIWCWRGPVGGHCFRPSGWIESVDRVAYLFWKAQLGTSLGYLKGRWKFSSESDSVSEALFSSYAGWPINFVVATKGGALNRQDTWSIKTTTMVLVYYDWRKSNGRVFPRNKSIMFNPNAFITTVYVNSG